MPPLLTVEKLSKRFGGIQALDDLDLEVVAGTVHGLIGPNGSGKSTALHVMSGFLKSDRGTVTFADRALDGMSPHRRAGIGIGRVFQSPAIFPELTVAQNVLVGCHTIHREGHRLFNVLFRPRKLAPLEAELRDRCLESLATVGLAARADEAAANLSYGDRKLLDLAKALVVQPKLPALRRAGGGACAARGRAAETAFRVAALRRYHHCGRRAQHEANAVALRSHHCVEFRPQDRGGPAGGNQSEPRSHRGIPRGSCEVMLSVSNLSAGYDGTPVLEAIDLSVGAGEVVAVLGSNGAGKSTLLKSISGLLRASCGSISLDDANIVGISPRQIVCMGVTHVPEGRRIFPGLSVSENLLMGGFTVRDKIKLNANLAMVFELFPRLAERRSQIGTTLSGGEQQMLSIARALMSSPRFLLLDEPSMGLAPVIVERLFD